MLYFLSFVCFVSGFVCYVSAFAHKQEVYHSKPSYAPASFSCPHGFEALGSNQCSQQVSIPAMPTCRPGFQMTQGRCVRATYSNAVKTCPPGADLVGKACVAQKFSAKQEICPAGFTPSHNGCQQVAITQAEALCHRGSYMSGECVEETHVKKRLECPLGYEMEQKSGDWWSHLLFGHKAPSCVAHSIDRLPAQWTCPGGHQLAGDACIEVVQPDVTCPHGFTYANNACEKPLERFETAYPVCPQGFSLSGGRMCVQTLEAPIDYVCPPGYEPLEELGNCAKFISQSPMVLCNKGYELHGSDCIWHQQVPMEEVCNPGAVLSHGRCVVEMVAPGELVCPHGATLSGGICLQTVTVSPLGMCPAGTMPDLHGRCVRQQLVKGPTQKMNLLHH
eukprot:Platyproteum_vivax@DN5324_c0_g1_i1.p1